MSAVVVRGMSPSVCHWPATLSQAQRARVIECAKWSQMAYSSSKTVTEASNMSNVTCINCEGCDAQSMIFNSSADTLVLAVRGTDSAKDMLCDIRVVQTLFEDIPDVFVHEGFNLQFKALSSVVNSRIMHHLVAGGLFVCTGHSLGAGVAALFAVSYGIRFPGLVSYFGYGSPRQGNAVFSQLMASQTSLAIIVKNVRDPVCASIPATCLLSQYEHAGLPLLIGNDPSPEFPDILHIADHDIAKYIENLEAKLPHKGKSKGCMIV